MFDRARTLEIFPGRSGSVQRSTHKQVYGRLQLLTVCWLIVVPRRWQRMVGHLLERCGRLAERCVAAHQRLHPDRSF